MTTSFEDMSTDQKSKEKRDFAIRLGKRLREVRTTHKLSQEELAHRAGYYRTYVGHVETAKYSPSVHTMWRFAKAMDMDLGELLKGL
ncbi:MAG: helix-turn-helix transcriptional regulator [Patescibacteria group bacterium]|nr:helix-turn-helix transcriptional regulator [Patescibacteria group bacterium]